MADYADYNPSRELLKVVRATLIMRDLSFSAYCKANNLTRQNASAALTGKWTGPKARAVVVWIVNDLEIAL